MSINAGVGSSYALDPDTATTEALKQAMEQMPSHEASAFFVFASPTKYNQEQVLKTLTSAYPNASITGCSTSGEISPIGPMDNSLVLMAISSDQIQFVPSFAQGLAQDPISTAEKFAKNMQIKGQMETPLVCFTFPDGLATNGSAILKGIINTFGSQSTIVGGSAADDFQFKKTCQYSGTSVLTNSITGMGLYGKFNYGIGVRHGWIPIGTSRVVTKSQSNVLQELDGKPAIAIYEDQFGKDKTQQKPGIPFANLAITYPLGVALPGQREFLIRDPLDVTPSGEIICTADIPVGSEVYIMIGSREEAIAASREAAGQALMQLNGKKPKAAFLFSSVARKKLLMNKRKDDINEVKAVIGESVPLIGFYTYGEQAPSLPHSACSFHNETNVVFLLAE